MNNNPTPNVAPKVKCDGCGKNISKINIAAHKKRCKKPLAPGNTYEDLQMLLTDKDKELRASVNRQMILLEENNLLKHQLENLKKGSNVTNQTADTINNNNTNNTNNNTNNININNNYYVVDLEGNRKGLDMNSIRSFGEENIDYIDKDKPLADILKQLYCDPAHLENKVLCHEFLNLEWILIKYKDHIKRFYLEEGHNVPDLARLICGNAAKLLGREFENYAEKEDAVKELLREMDNEVNTLIKQVGVVEANNRVPVWNTAQYEQAEQRRWKDYMMDPDYSMNRIDTKEWDKKGY